MFTKNDTVVAETKSQHMAPHITQYMCLKFTDINHFCHLTKCCSNNWTYFFYIFLSFLLKRKTKQFLLMYGSLRWFPIVYSLFFFFFILVFVSDRIEKQCNEMLPKEQYQLQEDLGRDVQRCYFSLFLSAVSSLCISLPLCFTHSSIGTPYLPAKTVFSNTESAERIIGSCESVTLGWCNTIIKAFRRQEQKGWQGMKYNVKTSRDEQDHICVVPVFLHTPFQHVITFYFSSSSVLLLKIVLQLAFHPSPVF